MKTDMSPNAITMRLKKTSELRKLCIALGGDRLKQKFKTQKVEQTRKAEEGNQKQYHGQ